MAAPLTQMPRLHGCPPDSTFFIAKLAPIVCQRAREARVRGGARKGSAVRKAGCGAPIWSRQRCCTSIGTPGKSCPRLAGLRCEGQAKCGKRRRRGQRLPRACVGERELQGTREGAPTEEHEL